MFIMGIDPTSTSSTQLFFPGTLGAISPPVSLYTAPMGQTGSTAGANPGDKVYVYVKFTTAVTVVNSACTMDALFNAAPTGAAMAAAANMGKMVGISQVTQVINNFGWLQVFGQANVAATTGATAYTQMFAGATAGQLFTTAAANVRVDGIVLNAIAAANTAVGFLNWPRVGGTTALA